MPKSFLWAAPGTAGNSWAALEKTGMCLNGIFLTVVKSMFRYYRPNAVWSKLTGGYLYIQMVVDQTCWLHTVYEVGTAADTMGLGLALQRQVATWAKQCCRMLRLNIDVLCFVLIIHACSMKSIHFYWCLMIINTCSRKSNNDFHWFMIVSHAFAMRSIDFQWVLCIFNAFSRKCNSCNWLLFISNAFPLNSSDMQYFLTVFNTIFIKIKSFL